MDDVIMVVLSVVVPAIILTMALVAFLRSDAQNEGEPTTDDPTRRDNDGRAEGDDEDDEIEESSESTDTTSDSDAGLPATDGETESVDEATKAEP